MKIDEKHRRDVLTGNIWKVVVFITAPLFLYQLINSFYSLIDQIMVSSINSESVSAVATIAQIKNLLSSLGSGLAAGGAILVARAYGAGDIEKARKNANVMFSMSLIIMGVILVAFLPMSTLILKIAQVPDELINISKSYFRLQLVEQLFIIFNSIFIGLEKAKCNTKIIFICNFMMMIVKLCLNALFIYGFKVDDLVFVELSSIISQASMSIVGCVYIFRKSNIFRITLKELSLKWAIVKKIIIVSFPLFLGKFVMSLGKVTVNAMCKAYGALTVGALGISNNMCGLITSPCLAFEESTSSIVSQNLGNKNMRRCLKVFLVSFTYLMIWMVVGFLVVRVFFMDEIIGLFNLKNDSLEFVNMIKNIFYYDCLTIPALAINCAVLGILYGYGQTFLATINNVIRIVTRISVLWYLQSFHPEIGAEAAGISMGISNILIACSALIFLTIFFIKVKVKGYKGMRFSDKEPKMVEVDGMLISEVVLNERNKNLK